ncbi:MAG: DUF2062 domain-containing protein [Desulfotomaculum sp.]|nr:DUF2062 domain-containing protein [Desulfotomaculum sp.]
MLSRFYNKFKQTYDKIMSLPDAPSKISGGVGIGAAMDFLPIPIVSIPVSFVIARALGLNGLAAALTAMILKVAVPIFYALNIMIGKLIISGHTGTPHTVAVHFELTSPQAWLMWLKSLGKPFLLGAGINSITAYIIVYFAFRRFLAYRQDKYQQKQVTTESSNK